MNACTLHTKIYLPDVEMRQRLTQALTRHAESECVMNSANIVLTYRAYGLIPLNV